MPAPPDLKLAMTLTARNVDDVIEANLDYHLAQGVDILIVTEHQSADKTPEILDRYAAEGKIHLLREPRAEWVQTEVVTGMARMAASEFGADWVINADADELWWPKIGTLKDVFSAVPDHLGAVKAPRFNMKLHPGKTGSFLQTMCVADVRSRKRPKPGKPTPNASVPPKAAHRAKPDAIVTRGSHEVVGPGLAVVPNWSPISVFHYPVRSLAQITRKLTWDRGASGRPPVAEEVLRRLWDEAALTDEELARGLAAGTLLIDERIARFTQQQTDGHGEPPPSRRDALETLRLDVLRTCWNEDSRQKHGHAPPPPPPPTFYERIRAAARTRRG